MRKIGPLLTCEMVDAVELKCMFRKNVNDGLMHMW